MLLKRNKIWILLLLLVLVIFSAETPVVQASSQDTDINIYFFWGEGCPHCATAHPVLESLAEENPRIGFYEFEVYNNPENVDLFMNFGEAFDMEPRGVPTTFIGERYWVGYSEEIRVEIESYLDNCLASGCPDPGGDIVFGKLPTAVEPTAIDPTEAPVPTETGIPTPVSPVATDEVPQNPGDGRTISLPLIGTVDLSSRSLLLSTLLISFVDGFNPCSIWVLSMLLAITLNTRSRKKVLIIGFVFIMVTGFIYAMFIGGLFTVFRIISFVGWIQVVVAVVAFIFAVVNIKDYFWYKEGVSFTISDDKKPGIYKKIRGVLNADDSLWGLIGGTIVLAAGVSLVEFSCTAGFPMLWSNLLAAQDITGLAFIGFLLVYMIVYQLDELGIFLVSVFTLRKSKLEEKHGRILKLLGGTLMLTLAFVMLIDPTIMNEIASSLWVFAFAFGLTALVLLVHRVILPKFDIHLGTEEKS